MTKCHYKIINTSLCPKTQTVVNR